MIETIIEISTWIIAIMLFYFFGIRANSREALLGFLFMQVITWPIGFLVTELKLISYPVRFLEYSSKSSFTFEYLAFPVVAGLYTVYYPKYSSKLKKIIYSLIIVSLLTGVEVILEKYTDNIEYLKWSWQLSWITMFVSLHITYGLSKWFLKKF